MALSITCSACGETKALDAFERLPSGGHRGVCIACRQAASKAYKRAAREALRATPEQQALRALKAAEREARAAQKEAARAAAAEARIARRAAEVAEREARAEAEQNERQEREAALREDLWAAMKRGRSNRALQAVRTERTGLHTIRLTLDQGYISIAEFACRVAERRACSRAVHACKTFETVAEAVEVLERPTPGLVRVKEVANRWHKVEPSSGPSLISALQGEEEPDEDAFAAAFGDWAPSWVGAMAA